MKTQTEVPSRLNDLYNHEKESVLEACGFTEKEANKLYRRAAKLEEDCTNFSGIIEKYAEEFNRKELALILVTGGATPRAKAKSKMQEMMSELESLAEKFRPEKGE